MQLSIGQKLQLTPQIRHAMRLLQLSNLELVAQIEAELESNPLLEETDDEDLGIDIDNPPTDRDIENVSGDDTDADPLEFSDPADSFENELDLTDIVSNFDTEESQFSEKNWNDLEDYNSISAVREDNQDLNYLENQAITESLTDHLISQLNLMNWSDLELLTATAIIDELNSDGLLRTELVDIQEIVSDMGFLVEVAQIEAVLRKVQEFDPDGVGARDLQECLLIQLSELDQSTDMRELAISIVSDHFDQLTENDLNGIAQNRSIAACLVDDAVALIRTLNPRPGAQFDRVAILYVEPDIEVTQTSSGWYVELVDSMLPKIRLNEGYVEALQRNGDRTDQTYLRENMARAKLLIDSIHYRNSTLLKTARSIVEHQYRFFEEGAEGMQPLVLSEIAALVGVHESTISRVVRSKYMKSPKGFFALKYFFSSKVNTSTGGEVSSVAIRAILKNLIDRENPKSPLSDSKITRMLHEQNIEIARRTVAKYRESMEIPASTERRKAS